MSLGALLKRYRLAAGLTQEGLAEKAAISARTVSDAERGLRTRFYRRTATLLADALGLEGTERDRFEVVAQGAQVPSRHELPRSLTSLVGRQLDLQRIESILRRDDIHLVTLTGPGGIGKSRLALEIAGRWGIGDVWWVDLGSIADAGHVITAVARTVGISTASPRTVESIAEHLRTTGGLVVLDTFEHLIAAAIEVARLASLCPGVRFVITSREPLAVRGEHTVGIPPLSLPNDSAMQVVMDAAATRLFVERATAARGDLAFEEIDGEVISDICHKVGGLPLAIELAAAHVRHMSLRELRDQLADRLAVLSGGLRDLPKRLQAMRNTIGWSYDLLAASERDLFRDLCVFNGGWNLEATRGVIGHDVMRDLSALVDKNLVTRALDSGRYGMLDVIHDFGLEQGVNAETMSRHLDYFVTLAEQAESGFGSSSQSAWVQQLDHDRANIRAALEYAIAVGDADRALRLTGAAWRFWMLDGSLAEGREALHDALDMDAAAPSPHRAKALWGAAWLAYHQGDYAATARCGDEMVKLAAADDPATLRNAWTVKGLVALAEECLPDAVEIFGACVEVLRERERDWLTATSLLNLGMAMAHAVDPRAPQILKEARTMYEELGDHRFAARTHIYGGYAAALRGEPDAATVSLREALETYLDLHDRWGISQALEGLAVTFALRDRTDIAPILAGAAEVLRESENRPPLPADRRLIERILQRAKGSADVAAWDLAWERGRSLEPDAAARWVLCDRR